MSNAGNAKPGTFLEDLNPPQVPHLEDYFQNEEHTVFSPTTQNLVSMDNLVLLVLGMKLLKTNPGAFKDIVVKYLDCCTKIIDSVESSSHGSHWMGCLVKETTVACIAHRIGLIDNGGYEKIVDQNRNIFDKLLTAEVAKDTLSGVTTLIQSSKTEGGAQGIGALATMLKAI